MYTNPRWIQVLRNEEFQICLLVKAVFVAPGDLGSRPGKVMIFALYALDVRGWHVLCEDKWVATWMVSKQYDHVLNKFEKNLISCLLMFVLSTKSWVGTLTGMRYISEIGNKKIRTDDVASFLSHVHSLPTSFAHATKPPSPPKPCVFTLKIS